MSEIGEIHAYRPPPPPPRQIPLRLSSMSEASLPVIPTLGHPVKTYSRDQIARTISKDSPQIPFLVAEESQPIRPGVGRELTCDFGHIEGEMEVKVPVILASDIIGDGAHKDSGRGVEIETSTLWYV